MDYKEKYEQALEVAQRFYNNSVAITKKGLEDIFPELKESEDEKIRKELLAWLKSRDGQILPIDRYNAAIAWLEKQGEHANFINKIQIGDKVTRNEDGILVNLSQLNRVAKKDEKQGEQKPADETKFKVGDWVVYCNDDVDLITGIEENGYSINNSGYIPFVCASDVRLWTIQDAKDGDVLCCENGWTCIFKTLVNDETFSSYCFMDNTKWFCETGSECHTLKEEFVKAYNGKIYPATKEQHDLLFQKMKEAGYEWNAEKKELKKIEQKPEWSEEDEKMLECALDMIEWYSGKNEDKSRLVSGWLKSLKERVQPQPKQYLSEDDEDIIATALSNTYSDDIATKLLNKINSLRPQKQWKPNGDQIDALYDMIRSFKKESSYSNRDDIANIVEALLEQLKAL